MQIERLWKWVSAGLALIVVVLLLCAFIMRPNDNGRYYFSVLSSGMHWCNVLAFDTRTGVVWARTVIMRRVDEKEGREARSVPWIQFGPRIPQVDNTTR